MTCFGRTILRFRTSLLILVVWSPGGCEFVVRPKAPVKGLFVDSKYNPVLEGYQLHPQTEDSLISQVCIKCDCSLKGSAWTRWLTTVFGSLLIETACVTEVPLPS